MDLKCLTMTNAVEDPTIITVVFVMHSLNRVAAVLTRFSGKLTKFPFFAIYHGEMFVCPEFNTYHLVLGIGYVVKKKQFISFRRTGCMVKPRILLAACTDTQVRHNKPA